MPEASRDSASEISSDTTDTLSKAGTAWRATITAKFRGSEGSVPNGTALGSTTERSIRASTDFPEL